MKKLILIIIIASLINACNGPSSDNSATKDSSTNVASTDTTMNSMSRSMSPFAEGTVGMRQGKMMMVHDSGWKLMTETVSCSDGCRVMPNGEVVMKNGDKMMLKDGETVDKEGHMMDKNGKMMISEKMDSMKMK